MQCFVRLLALYSVVISMTACAPAPSSSVVRPAIQKSGRIGVISSAVQPGAEITGLPPRGTVDGALAGTAAGSLVGAFECLIYLYPLLPAYPICVAVIATAGTGAGMAAAEPPEIVDAAQEKFTRVLTERDWQVSLRQRVVEIAVERYAPDVVDLGTAHLSPNSLNLSGTEQAPEHVHGIKPVRGADAAPSDLSMHADTLMEVALVKLSTWFSGDHKFGFVLAGQAQLVRASDFSILASSNHYYVSPSLPLTKWIDRDGALVRETVIAGVNYLAQEMVREQLHAP